ncbi:BZ3500_MvSof-1268-A1-R1_Chr8-2g10075 [Microbotryum saponariae]|uniref:BZ3500_MvSof-1268-A1-R1_Chr8-2g10075 protein n=1 Tax=Microbotryum saponariae TaxID=289078 RepID=A0A2X0LYN7_9BASI|nr:BZ3500_MvSof-1268-A1-R1_Chr8-2g10075 [Microbotryum saponariae]SDA01735.1 BZ3501_MvSof-1269-A2-R1_Chr8-2g09826 [Microbotryum saponariae]
MKACYITDSKFDAAKLKDILAGHHLKPRGDFESSRKQLFDHQCTKLCLFRGADVIEAGVQTDSIQFLTEGEVAEVVQKAKDEHDLQRARARVLRHMHIQETPGTTAKQSQRHLHPVTLNTRKNFHVCVDTGADLCFVAPYIPRQLGARIHMYNQAQTLRLGTKGSQSKVNSYCILDIEFAGVKKPQHFEVANVYYDVIIGDDFLRKYDCVVTFNPDEVVSRQPDPIQETPVKKAERASRPRQKKKRRDQGHAPIEAQSKLQRNIGEAHDFDQDEWDDDNELVIHFGSMTTMDDTLTMKTREIRDLENQATIPVYPSAGQEDSPDYEPTEEDKNRYKMWLLFTFGKIFIGEGDKLPFPPMRAVMHKIPYIDKSDPPRPRRHYKVADAMMDKWVTLKDQHVEAGLWIPASTKNADPMMPILKKDGKARPVVDLRARNANTVKMSIPAVDADYIRSRIATNKYHVELDLKGAFQQLRIKPSDIWKTAFTSIHGMYTTPVAQQGDTNSPATLVRMISYVYQGLLGKQMEAYTDNIFVVGNTWKEIRDHTISVLVRFQVHELCFSTSSLKVCPE